MYRDGFAKVRQKMAVEDAIKGIGHKSCSRRTLERDVELLCFAPTTARLSASYARSANASFATTAAEIKKLETLSSKIAKCIAKMHRPSRKLVEGDLSKVQLIPFGREAEVVYKAAHEARKSLRANLYHQSKVRKGRSSETPANALTLEFARLYKRRTGKLPTRVINRETGKAESPFVLVLQKLFEILEIDANADVATRTLLRRDHLWLK